MGVHKRMEWNDHKGMEMNGMKRNDHKGMEMNENEWNASNLVWEQHGGNGMESFYDNITIRPIF